MKTLKTLILAACTISIISCTSDDSNREIEVEELVGGITGTELNGEITEDSS